MSRIYRRTPKGNFSYGAYHYSQFWLMILLVVSVALWQGWEKLGFEAFQVAQGLVAIPLVVSLVLTLAKVVRGTYRNRSLVKYISASSIEHAVRRALLSTMTLNSQKENVEKVEVPAVKVVVSASSISLYVAKLPGMYDLDRLTEDINSSIRGKYKGYAVTTAIAEEDGTGYNFTLEDVATDRTFVPRTIDDIVQDPYCIKLQEGLVVSFAHYQNCGVYGQIGSGKSTVLLAITAEMLPSADLYYIDPKGEFEALGVFYPKDRIASTTSEILSLLYRLVDLMKKRQEKLEKAVEKQRKLGLTGFSIKLTPVVLIADELGSVVASLSSKEKKEYLGLLTQLVQRGRAMSVFCVLASQSPATDVIPQGIRAQLSVKILLGSANPDIQRMAFDGQVATAGGVPKFQGYYTVSGLTVLPQKFFVPNFFKYGLENLDTFEKLYKMRKR